MTPHRAKLPIPWPSRIYYGWAIVGVAFVINGAMAPTNPGTFGFFIGPIGDDLGLSLSQVSWAYTIRLVLGGVAAPFVGIALDRIGARWLGVVMGLAVVVGFLGQAMVHTAWAWYLLFAMPGLFGIGGPAGSLISVVPASRWFVAKRGRAIALGFTGQTIGGVISILLAPALEGMLGWRGAFVVYGVVCGVLVVPLSFLVMRRAPEDLGMHPDGAAEAPAPLTEPAQAKDRALPGREEANWTAGQAMRTPVYWLVLAGLSMFGFAVSGVIVNRVPFWESVGMSSSVVALGIAADPFMVTFALLAFGFWGERMNIRRMALMGGAGLAVSMLPMMFTDGQVWTLFANTIVWGIAAGAYITVNSLVLPRYFGRLHLGAIRGISLPFIIAATGIGAPAFGWLVDHDVSQTNIWGLAAGMFAGGGLLLFVARRPRLQARR